MNKFIGLVQASTLLGRIEENYKNIGNLIRTLATSFKVKPDIIVLPETFNTGFYPHEDLRQIADKNGERTKDFLSSSALKYNINIVGGSVTTLKDDKLYNTCYTFDRTGQLVNEYDKIHTFSPAKEHEIYAAGNKTCTFELDGIKCTSIICYDLRFPELSKMLALQGVELFFVPAQWPTIRLYPWQTLLRARAIENQAFYCGVNACGYVDVEQKYGNFGGHSAVIDPLGNPLVELSTKEEISIAEIDLTQIQKIRHKMNILNDRRPELYKL